MNKIEFKQFLQNTKDNIQEKLNPKKIGTKISVSLKSKKTRKNLIIYAFLTLFCIVFPDKIKSRRIHTTMYIPFNIFDIYVQNGTFFHKTDTLGNLCYNHHSRIRCDNQ